MAERVAREVATALAPLDAFNAVNKAQFAVESLGLPKARIGIEGIESVVLVDTPLAECRHV